jgi:GTPase
MDSKLFENLKNNTDHVFFVDGIYNKNGIGLILAGMNRGGTINVGDIMYLGPFGKEFKEVKVKSMQNYLQEKIMSAGDHSRITIAIGTNDKEINRKTLRGGMVLLKNKELVKNYLTYHITAAITIFHHSATLRDGYSPMLQIGNVRQTGRMILEPAKNDSKDYIKSKDFAYVTFKFKQRPEYIEPYQVFVFRSGGVHGVGIVLGTLPVNIDMDARPDPHKLKNKVRKFLK